MTDLERAYALVHSDPEHIEAALAAARREGAEAALAKLNEALSNGDPEAWHKIDVAIPGTVAAAERRGAAEMRERAAAECERHAKFCEDEAHKTGDWGHLMTRFEEATYNAQSIRALPLTPEEPQA